MELFHDLENHVELLELVLKEKKLIREKINHLEGGEEHGDSEIQKKKFKK